MKMSPLLVAVVIYGSAYAADTNRLLSEEALLAYASAPFDRVDKHVITLGQLNGTPVIAEFICSDVCPDYTVRVIRYDLKKDQTCSGVGGVEKALRIPVSIAATDKTFCFPEVLVNNWGNIKRSSVIYRLGSVRMSKWPPNNALQATPKSGAPELDRWAP